MKYKLHQTKNSYNKRLLHDIFLIGPGISPRLSYQARETVYVYCRKISNLFVRDCEKGKKSET